ncbi:hypothetical protein COHA_010809 [Chlorella ohadii]|uniref:Uncharacterized protein n=1 Tax=Chlorella ohadii TaxID=2649997 RepID=A0AAD5DJ44_9CHLO|nr:hypothetical protein COHA_010809 [Chlorella ohadii]
MASKPAAAEPAGPAGPTLPQINQAIRAGDHETLAKLLSLGPRPEVPLDDGNDFVDSICFSYDGSQGSDFYDVRDLQDPLYTLLLCGGMQDSRVAMCEALLAAGFRPTVYPEVQFEARLTLRNLNIVFGWDRPDVVKEVADFERGVPQPVAVPQLDGPDRDTCPLVSGSLLAMLIKGEPWSPADHQHYPPTFCAAVRTLLLAHRRSGTAVARRSTRAASRKAAVESQVCSLSQLEPECLMAIVRHLAEPPLAPWLFKQPWGKVTGPDMDAIYGTSVDDHWPPLEW